MAGKNKKRRCDEQKPCDDTHRRDIGKAVDKALAKYARGLPEGHRPSRDVVCQGLLEKTLEYIYETSEGAGLAWEMILPRLAAFNVEWANDCRRELAAIQADEAWDEEHGYDDDVEDEDDELEEDDEEADEDDGIPFGTVEEHNQDWLARHFPG